MNEGARMAAVTAVLSVALGIAGGWAIGLVAALHLAGVTVLVVLFRRDAPAAPPPQTEPPPVQPPFSGGEDDVGGT